MSLGQYGDAEQYYKKAISIEPEFINALNNLSIALALQGRQEESEQCAKKAAEVGQARLLNKK